MNQSLILKETNLYQSNELTIASYYLPIQSQRVLWLCLQQIPFGDSLESGEFVVSVSDYSSLFGISSNQASKDIKMAAENLLTSYVTFKDETGEWDELKRPWLQEQGIKEARGKWKFNLNNKILPYISSLNSEFTMLRLNECNRMNNPRFIRLYANLCRWRSAQQFITSPEWLADRIQLPDSQRGNYAEMKRRFIAPAIKEINEKTSMKVNVIEKRELGTKRVTSLMFTMD